MKADFSDLSTRSMSAVVMLAIAGFSIWNAGDIFKVILIITAALMAWEISRMHVSRPILAIITAIIVGGCTSLTFYPIGLSAIFILGLQIIMALVLAEIHKTSRFILFISFITIVFGTTALGFFREEYGLILTLWLLLCIIASDIGGYFAGKMFGGPKLWTKISPKKTWSGTIGGWVLAAMIGAFFVVTGQSTWLILISVLVAIAAQSGDLAESAIKRRTGVKDSSNLIPGHGGFLDRFDGVLGVCLLVFFANITGII